MNTVPLTLRYRAPAAVRVKLSQANAVTFACTWGDTAAAPATFDLRAEIHTSRTVPPGTTPLASVNLPGLTAGTAQPWAITFTGAQMNQPIPNRPTRQLWLIVYLTTGSAPVTAAAVEITLEYHAISGITAPPPPAALYLTEDRADELFAARSTVEEIDLRLSNIEDDFNSPGNGAGGANVAAVLYTEQSLTSQQQTRARLNIAAAGLDGNGRLLVSQLPDLAVSEFLGAPTSQAAMLNLTGQRGDWCHRGDRGTNWIAIAEPTSLLSSWREMSYPASPVTSVAGRTGAVTLSIGDVNSLTEQLIAIAAALAAKADDGHGHGTASATEDGFMSAQHAEKLNALPDAATLANSLAGKADLIDGQLDPAQLPPLAISEFLGTAGTENDMLLLAGQRGDWCIRDDFGTVWVLTADNHGALASWTQLRYPTAPVTSVAGRTGAITLTAADIISGQFAPALLPLPTHGSIGGVRATTRPAGQFVVGINTLTGALLYEAPPSGSPAGTDGQVQYRLSATTFGAVSGITLAAGSLQSLAFSWGGAAWSMAINFPGGAGVFSPASNALSIGFGGSEFARFLGSGASQLILASAVTVRTNGAFSPGVLIQGALDSPAPVSQRSGVQNVATGTLNTPGEDRHYDASRGTGTGAGGAHVFHVATSGASGSGQNALVEAMRIRQDRAVFVANVSAEPPTPTGGGVYYVQDGALRYKGSSGTVTTIAPA